MEPSAKRTGTDGCSVVVEVVTGGSRSARETEVGLDDFELGDGEIIGLGTNVDVEEANEADRDGMSNVAMSAKVGDGGWSVTTRPDKSSRDSSITVSTTWSRASWLSIVLQSNNNSRSGSHGVVSINGGDDDGGESCAT